MAELLVELLRLRSPIKELEQEAVKHPKFSKGKASNEPGWQGRNAVRTDKEEHLKHSVAHVQVFNLYSHHTAYLRVFELHYKPLIWWHSRRPREPTLSDATQTL